MSIEHYERRRRSFERTAAAYDRYRPRYPDAIFEDIRRYADLAPDDAILDVGCGTGRATLPLAAWGNPLVALEPARAMADVARANLSAFPNVEVRVERFEETTLRPRSFGLLTCAQAWHWLDPDTRLERVAGLLYSYGSAAIVANIQVVGDDPSFLERVQEVYFRHVPAELAGDGRALELDSVPDQEHKREFRTRDDLPEHPMTDSPLFRDLEQVSHEWHWTLSTDDYVGLCATHSDKAALDETTRRRLLDGIAELIEDEFGGEVTEHYVAVAGLARSL